MGVVQLGVVQLGVVQLGVVQMGVDLEIYIIFWENEPTAKGPGTLNGVVKLWMSCVFLVLPGLQMNSKADHNPHAN